MAGPDPLLEAAAVEDMSLEAPKLHHAVDVAKVLHAYCALHTLSESQPAERDPLELPVRVPHILNVVAVDARHAAQAAAARAEIDRETAAEPHEKDAHEVEYLRVAYVPQFLIIQVVVQGEGLVNVVDQSDAGTAEKAKHDIQHVRRVKGKRQDHGQVDEYGEEDHQLEELFEPGLIKLTRRSLRML